MFVTVIDSTMTLTMVTMVVHVSMRTHIVGKVLCMDRRCVDGVLMYDISITLLARVGRVSVVGAATRMFRPMPMPMPMPVTMAMAMAMTVAMVTLATCNV
mmetsp:Transcript_13091/g.23251  ORF Transcript_13091/g.23251 Transcript_13091/m.23251 type:complete len:100 (+) Transcript_13091:254-553(+)